MKIIENENSDKYLDLAKELRKHWSRRVTVILFVIGRRRMAKRGKIGKSEDESGSS